MKQANIFNAIVPAEVRLGERTGEDSISDCVGHKWYAQIMTNSNPIWFDFNPISNLAQIRLK